MAAKIFKKGLDWLIEYYDKKGSHLEYCGEWISGSEDSPLSLAVKQARYWGCKSICITY